MLLLPKYKKRIIAWAIAIVIPIVVILPVYFCTDFGLSNTLLIPGLVYLAGCALLFIGRSGTFDLFAYHELRDTAADCEDKYDQLERMMKCPDEDQQALFERKQSREFAGEMEGFLAVLEDRLMDFKEIRFKGMKLTEEELIQMFYFRFQETPLLERA